MRDYLQVLIFIVLGIILVWFVYAIFMGQWMKIRSQIKSMPKKRQPPKKAAAPGDPKICPLCKSKLAAGELVQTKAYASMAGTHERLMHIQGCVYCLRGDYPRFCPVCKVSLGPSDKLVARMFDRPNRRSHVHILGCFLCRKKTM